MAWRRPGDKPFSEPMMVRLSTHICVTRHQWVECHVRFTLQKGVVYRLVPIASMVTIEVHADSMTGERFSHCYLSFDVFVFLKCTCCSSKSRDAFDLRRDTGTIMWRHCSGSARLRTWSLFNVALFLTRGPFISNTDDNVPFNPEPHIVKELFFP